MAERVRAFDWTGTPLGPIAQWPQSLKTAVGMVLLSPVPIVMLWGDDGIMIYNDGYSEFAGHAIRPCSDRRCARAGPKSPTSTTTS